MAERPEDRRPDALRLEAWRTFLQAQRVVLDRLEDELRAEHGMTLSAYDVLVHLYEAPRQRLRMNQLASSVVLTPSGITRLVDRLESAGLVERQMCATERRAIEVVLTPAGRDRFRKAAKTHLRGVAEHFTRYLDDRDAVTLRRAFGEMVAAARAESVGVSR